MTILHKQNNSTFPVYYNYFLNSIISRNKQAQLLLKNNFRTHILVFVLLVIQLSYTTKRKTIGQIILIFINDFKVTSIIANKEKVLTFYSNLLPDHHKKSIRSMMLLFQSADSEVIVVKMLKLLKAKIAVEGIFQCCILRKYAFSKFYQYALEHCSGHRFTVK